MESKFQKEYSLKKRLSESTRIIRKYPNRIPIICERYGSSNIPNIDRNKYLVPSDLTVGQFLYVIRKRIKLSPESSIFIYVNNSLPATSKLIKDLYKNESNEDGFLYILYSGENTFG
jgi:GABA(A) receptor-associated protein